MRYEFVRCAAFGACLVTALVTLALPGRADAQRLNLQRLVMPGPVVQVHQAVEENCNSCHVENDGDSQDSLCGACHIEILSDRSARTGFHGRNPAAALDGCFSCHQEHEGRDAQIILFDESSFDHDQTDFPLAGAHLAQVCGDCHDSRLTYRETPNECVDCHTENDVHMGVLGTACADCHSEADWLDVEFDHSTTLFPLSGAHQEAVCVDCHRNQTFVGTPLRCAACHAPDDVHNGRNGTACADCHSDQSWLLPNFDHWMAAGFALEGAHQGAACQSCHTVDLETALPQTCFGCHQSDDSHGGRLGEDCSSCHNSVSWANTGFDHLSATSFDLVGAHAVIECVDCHVTSISTALPNDCAGCHEPDPHAGQLGQQCASCHAEMSWNADVLFDHGLSQFPLLGLHAQAQCNDCHENLAFHDAAEECIDCHVDADIHAGAFGTDCASCHNPVAWQAWIFDHNIVGAFPLTGAHRELSCATCHQQDLQAMAGTGATCASCHRHDDPHEGRFGPACGSCHSTESF